MTFKDQVKVMPDKILSAQSKKDTIANRFVQHATTVENDAKSLLKAQEARVKRERKVF